MVALLRTYYCAASVPLVVKFLYPGTILSMAMRFSSNLKTAVKYPTLFLILTLLSACGVNAAPNATAAPSAQASPYQVTEVVRTIAAPTVTASTTAAATDTAAPTPENPCGYPANGITNSLCVTPEDSTPAAENNTPAGYPPPELAVLPAITATPHLPQSALQPTVTPAPISYTDCARAPGLPICSAEAVPLQGHLAFLDWLAPRVIVLDLKTGAGWQVPLTGEADWLAWSPDGSELLTALPEDLYVLYAANGSQVEAFSSETIPAWQPDGQLTLNGAVRTADGWSARLVRAREEVWDLRFKHANDAERILPLDDLPADSFYALRGWIPGTQKVLFQSYSAGGGALFNGGRLLVADTLAATITPFDVSAPLNNDAFAFNPARGTLLAFLTTAGAGPEARGPEGGSRLALLDFETNQLRYPLPEGVIPTGMDWQPGGERLAFSIGLLAPNASDEARQAFPAPGIYLLDPQSGAIEALVQSPTQATDGWPHWFADGQVLLYARTLPQKSGLQAVEIRAHQLDSRKDWLVIQNLPTPPTAAAKPAWDRVMAIGK